MKILSDRPSGQLNTESGIDLHNWDDPAHLAVSQLRMDALFPTVALEPGRRTLDLPRAAAPLEIDGWRFTDPLRPGALISGQAFLDRRLFNDALMVIHRGRVVHESYRNGMGPQDRHVLHSCTKSLCSMLVSIAVAEGKLERSTGFARYVPELSGVPAWEGVTLQHLLDMQAGLEYSEDYTDPDADYWRYARAVGYYPPRAGEAAIGVRAWVLANLNRRCAPPGHEFRYNSCLTNLLGIALENVYGAPLAELFETRLYGRVGAEAEGYFNTDPQGFPITEGQFSARLRDFARLAMLLVDDGRNLAGEQVLPPGFTERFTAPDAAAQAAYQRCSPDPVFPTGQYREQFWVLDPDAAHFTMLGIHGQFAWFAPRQALLVLGFGSFPRQDGELMMKTLKALWHGVAEQVA